MFKDYGNINYMKQRKVQIKLMNKLLFCIGRQVKHLVINVKLIRVTKTALSSEFEKLTFRV